MGKQVQLFNGKRILLFVLGILVLLCAGVLIFHLLKKEKYDVSHTSLDEQVTLTLNDLADSEPWRNQGQVHYTAFTVEDIKDLSEKVKKSPYYIYTVDYKDKPESNIEEGYLFCKDGHYFYMTVEKDYVYLRDLVTEISFFEGGGPYCYLPVLYCPADGKQLDFNENVASWSFEWDETVGLTSFDDLVMYYSKMDKDKYQVFEEANRIELKHFEFYSFMNSTEWSGYTSVIVTASDKGIVISIKPELVNTMRERREGIFK